MNWYLHELNTPFQMAPRERCAGVCVCVTSTAARRCTRARVSVSACVVVSVSACCPVGRNPHPFGQIPCLKDGSIEIFESGAILLYLAQKYGGLRW